MDSFTAETDRENEREETAHQRGKKGSTGTSLVVGGSSERSWGSPAARRRR
jgi:hypothetical protein